MLSGFTLSILYCLLVSSSQGHWEVTLDSHFIDGEVRCSKVTEALKNTSWWQERIQVQASVWIQSSKSGVYPLTPFPFLRRGRRELPVSPRFGHILREPFWASCPRECGGPSSPACLRSRWCLLVPLQPAKAGMETNAILPALPSSRLDSRQRSWSCTGHLPALCPGAAPAALAVSGRAKACTGGGPGATWTRGRRWGVGGCVTSMQPPLC